MSSLAICGCKKSSNVGAYRIPSQPRTGRPPGSKLLTWPSGDGVELLADCLAPAYPGESLMAAGVRTLASLGPLSPAAVEAGIQDGTLSPHTSRTLMLSDLRALLDTVPSPARRAQYRAAVVDDNVLLKPTTRTRKKTFEVLGQLYGLDPSLKVFRALRDLWAAAGNPGQPVLAVLCALCRDPAFRATAPAILEAAPGTVVSPAQLAEAELATYPDRFNATTLLAVAQHAASSWQQGGHLRGRVGKVRDRAVCTPAATTYALFLGHLTGARGDALFRTLWAAVLDAPDYVVREQAAAASRRGWLEYRAAGGVTEVSFRHLLRPPETRGETE